MCMKRLSRSFSIRLSVRFRIFTISHPRPVPKTQCCTSTLSLQMSAMELRATRWRYGQHCYAPSLRSCCWLNVVAYWRPLPKKCGCWRNIRKGHASQALLFICGQTPCRQPHHQGQPQEATAATVALYDSCTAQPRPRLRFFEEERERVVGAIPMGGGAK